MHFGKLQRLDTHQRWVINRSKHVKAVRVAVQADETEISVDILEDIRRSCNRLNTACSKITCSVGSEENFEACLPALLQSLQVIAFEVWRRHSVRFKDRRNQRAPNTRGEIRVIGERQQRNVSAIRLIRRSQTCQHR